MAASKSVPRPLQQPHPRDDQGEGRAWRDPQQAGKGQFQAASPGRWSTSRTERSFPGRAANKGDLRPQVDATKPSKEREVGDLEQSEREVHGCAQAGRRGQG